MLRFPSREFAWLLLVKVKLQVPSFYKQESLLHNSPSHPPQFWELSLKKFKTLSHKNLLCYAKIFDEVEFLYTFKRLGISTDE